MPKRFRVLGWQMCSGYPAKGLGWVRVAWALGISVGWVARALGIGMVWVGSHRPRPNPIGNDPTQTPSPCDGRPQPNPNPSLAPKTWVGYVGEGLSRDMTQPVPNPYPFTTLRFQSARCNLLLAKIKSLLIS
ncbi:hypothetical protein IAQ61_001594 [Plenodomus lingam]|uniref:uncharacterized protein n=1 Tax=Leptosphaeria maculans TaxID=5022 RepID=UPI0033172B69|nr:hypothetical protein IAQ61_001594 [Plenodomus lingam]